MPLNGTSLQRTRSVIHALSRTDNTHTRPPPDEQRVPAYRGSQSCRYPPSCKSKPYYHAAYNEPPSKSVLFDIMLKLIEAMRQKGIPFSFLVGDMPTYKLVTQLKAEHPHQFKDIVPILGAFHQQMSYIYQIKSNQIKFIAIFTANYFPYIIQHSQCSTPMFNSSTRRHVFTQSHMCMHMCMCIYAYTFVYI